MEGECCKHCVTLTPAGWGDPDYNQATSNNEDTDIIKIVKENSRQETRGQLESPRSP